MTRPPALQAYGRELGALALALLWCVPFYYLAIVSLKPTSEIFADPAGFPDRLAFANYAEAWAGTMGVTLGQAMVNSLIVTIGAVVAVIAIGSVTAYVIARNGRRMGTLLFFFFVTGIILPHQLSVVPLYSVMRQVGLVGNHIGLIILYSGLMTPMSVFLYCGFVRTLPADYEEAAEVDGASRARIFRKVIFPLLAPVTGTVAVMVGMVVWNDFFIQLIFLSGSPAQTLPVAIYGFVGEFSARWNLVFAAVFVSIGPILAFYLLAQKQLIKGFTGGIK